MSFTDWYFLNKAIGTEKVMIIIAVIVVILIVLLILLKKWK